MSEEPLFTLRELADRLSLPESTIRYYRDAFLDHIPSVGTGRRRRYPEPALAILRTIAESYAANRQRDEILRLIEGVAPTAPAERVAAPAKQARRRRSHDTTEVTNLDLLAAIVDGEREQREALWQMAQEIVRLTQVLESQEKVLGELSEHTGMQLRAPDSLSYLVGDAARMPALGHGNAPELRPAPQAPPATASPTAEPPAAPPTILAWLADLSLTEPRTSAAPEPAPVAAPAPDATPSAPAATPAAPDAAPPAPAGASGASSSDIDRLRRELEAERALVDRLRESKLKLEQRTAEAEEAVAETRARRRTSVIGRLLQTDRDAP